MKKEEKSEKRELSVEEEVVRDCPLLFDMYGKPPTKSCMAFGFECGKGWHEDIASAAREIETVNRVFYRKYRIRIQADQIKEKFGGLRFYYSVVSDHGVFLTFLLNSLEHLQRRLDDRREFDYAPKTVVDVEPFDYDEISEIDEKTYEERISGAFKPTNAEWKKENGKFLEIIHLRNYGKRHVEPTRLKFLWKIKETIRRVENALDRIFEIKGSPEKRNCVEFMTRFADRTIRDLEKRCGASCEYCGSRIGTDWSPACETTGYIRRLCDRCAEKSGLKYFKNGELWLGNEKIEKSPPAER